MGAGGTWEGVGGYGGGAGWDRARQGDLRRVKLFGACWKLPGRGPAAWLLTAAWLRPGPWWDLALPLAPRTAPLARPDRPAAPSSPPQLPHRSPPLPSTRASSVLGCSGAPRFLRLPDSLVDARSLPPPTSKLTRAHSEGGKGLASGLPGTKEARDGVYDRQVDGGARSGSRTQGERCPARPSRGSHSCGRCC